jgi:hypothetical protein
MLASAPSTVAPGWTTNGSTGARRKRDFFSIRQIIAVATAKLETQVEAGVTGRWKLAAGS